jgi:hypothetical protein
MLLLTILAMGCANDPLKKDLDQSPETLAKLAAEVQAAQQTPTAMTAEEFVATFDEQLAADRELARQELKEFCEEILIIPGECDE